MKSTKALFIFWLFASPALAQVGYCKQGGQCTLSSLTVTGTATFSGAIGSTSFNASAASGAKAFSSLQGARTNFDGATGAKYISSDGTTLTFTGLGATITGNLFAQSSITNNSGVLPVLLNDVHGTCIGDGTGTNCDGALTIASATASGTIQAQFFTQTNQDFACTSTSTFNFTGNISAANASTTVSAFRYLPLNALDANDLIFNVATSTGTRNFTVDVEGDGFFRGSLSTASLSATGFAAESGTVRLGVNGSLFTNFVGGHATLDFGSALINTCNDLTLSVAGSTFNAQVIIGLPTPPPTGSVFNAWVSAGDTITIRHCCVGAATCDPPSDDYWVRLFNN